MPDWESTGQEIFLVSALSYVCGYVSVGAALPSCFSSAQTAMARPLRTATVSHWQALAESLLMGHLDCSQLTLWLTRAILVLCWLLEVSDLVLPQRPHNYQFTKGFMKTWLLGVFFSRLCVEHPPSAAGWLSHHFLEHSTHPTTVTPKTKLKLWTWKIAGTLIIFFCCIFAMSMTFHTLPARNLPVCLSYPVN